MATNDFLYFFSSAVKANGSHIYSQWYECHIVSQVGKKDFKFISAEQLMMYEKAILFGDNDVAKKILTATSQKQIKSLGRQVKNFVEAVWNENKFNIVVKNNFLKFSQNNDLKQALLNTKNKMLVEASPYDKIWGIGLRENEAKKIDPSKWPGENLLGKALVKVREMLQE